MDGKTYRFAYINYAQVGREYVVMADLTDVSTLYPPSELESVIQNGNAKRVGDFYTDTYTIVFNRAPWNGYDWYVSPNGKIKVKTS